MSGEIVAPTDAQLGYIASLCADREIPFPEAVHSEAEASEIITAIRLRTYDPRRYRIEREAVDRGEPDWQEQADQGPAPWPYNEDSF